MKRRDYRDFIGDLHKAAKEQGYTGEAVERMLCEHGERLRESRDEGGVAVDIFNEGRTAKSTFGGHALVPTKPKQHQK